MSLPLDLSLGTSMCIVERMRRRPSWPNLSKALDEGLSLVVTVDTVEDTFGRLVFRHQGRNHL